MDADGACDPPLAKRRKLREEAVLGFADLPADMIIAIGTALCGDGEYNVWGLIACANRQLNDLCRARLSHVLFEFDSCTVTVDGNDTVYTGEQLGREQRTIEQSTGTRIWRRCGKWHRDGDLPAAEFDDGSKLWYRHGKCHRDGNLPAVQLADGGKFWCRAGKLHRDGDLPAVEFADGGKLWYRDGKLHRDGDRPAVERANGSKEWWRDGVEYTPELCHCADDVP